MLGAGEAGSVRGETRSGKQGAKTSFTLRPLPDELDVQNNEGLPSSRRVLHFEPVEGNGFYVNDQLVPFGVDLLTPAGCFYRVKPIVVSTETPF